MAAKAQQVKEKLKNFLHHDKADKQETTPNAAPGYADLDNLPTNKTTDTTTNVPEAFFPGSRPVVPNETHPTDPYTSALGLTQVPPPTQAPPQATDRSYAAPQPAASTPADSAAMMGAPPSGKDLEDTKAAEEPDQAAEVGGSRPPTSPVDPKEFSKTNAVPTEEQDDVLGEGGTIPALEEMASTGDTKEIPKTNAVPTEDQDEVLEGGETIPALEEMGKGSTEVPSTEAEPKGEPEQSTGEGESLTAPATESEGQTTGEESEPLAEKSAEEPSEPAAEKSEEQPLTESPTEEKGVGESAPPSEESSADQPSTEEESKDALTEEKPPTDSFEGEKPEEETFEAATDKFPDTEETSSESAIPQGSESEDTPVPHKQDEASEQ